MSYEFTPEKAKIIQRNLKYIRKYLGYTQKEFGKLFGRSGTHILNLENNYLWFKARHYYALIRVLHKLWETREVPMREDELTKLFTEPVEVR